MNGTDGRRPPVPSAAIALAATHLTSACAGKQPPPPAPIAVEIVPVVQKDVPIVGEWIGTLDGSVNADPRGIRTTRTARSYRGR